MSATHCGTGTARPSPLCGAACTAGEAAVAHVSRRCLRLGLCEVCGRTLTTAGGGGARRAPPELLTSCLRGRRVASCQCGERLRAEERGKRVRRSSGSTRRGEEVVAEESPALSPLGRDGGAYMHRRSDVPRRHGEAGRKQGAGRARRRAFGEGERKRRAEKKKRKRTKHTMTGFSFTLLPPPLSAGSLSHTQIKYKKKESTATTSRQKYP